MNMTAKEHFKVMYGAVRMGRIPALITTAAFDASDDFGRGFAVKVAIAARLAADDCFHRDLKLRLTIFKNDKEFQCESRRLVEHVSPVLGGAR
ncbi:hypothetical protein C9J12_11700 [Photobacterium frigidiphilum]|uniref:Uncharacterized protein n=1 Tax=Photobacterium frigidiphilum TaxID=264736 RepID=A0A2T3JH55_9GAMM|nr:hypothetical protein [Photobacterium frigidiphilum]PSU48278.1 hypothetical protein C9J12_11700 [Photobacterium frigidiphilum]